MGLKTLHPPLTNTSLLSQFYQADLTLDYIDGYKDKTGKMKEGFLNYATKVGVLLGGSESDVRAKVEDVYEFEKNLSLVGLSSVSTLMGLCHQLSKIKSKCAPRIKIETIN